MAKLSITAHHMPLPSVRLSQSMLSHQIYWRSILLPYPLRLPLQSGFFPSHFPTKTPHSFLFLLIRATCRERLMHLHLLTLLILSLSAPLSRMSRACVISLMWETKFHTHTIQQTKWHTYLLHGTLCKYSITHKPLPTVKSSSST